MVIEKNMDENSLSIKLIGRLDTTTAPQLEAELKKDISGKSELIFDLDELEYISSAGLRVILASQKVMNKQGHMIVRNVKESVMDVFELTGFVDILTLE